MTLRVLGGVAGAILCFGVSGCAMSPPPADAYYRLEASDAARASGSVALPGILEVGALRADPLTGGRAMLFREDSSALEVRRHAYFHWVDAPASMLQLELADYLRDSGVATRVITSGTRVISDYLLSGYVTRLERVQGDEPHVLVELSFMLVERERRALRLQESYRGKFAAVSDTVEAAVDAYREALDEIFAQLVADLRRSAEAEPRP